MRRLRKPDKEAGVSPAQQWLVAIVGCGATVLFVYRWLFLHGAWQPLVAHVDGLLLIGALFAGLVAYVQNRRALVGLSAFALPVLTLILAWAVCASAWTYYPFRPASLHPVWMGVHLAGVYLGTLCAAVAAIAGGMFLYVQSRLKHKQGLATFGRLASLETLETLIVRTATLGFALLTLGLASGMVILVSEEGELTPGWWYGPKIVLATLAWLVYAVLMNVRHATSFRGVKAAWLSIAGLVLLIGIYAIVTAWPASEAMEQPAVSGSPNAHVQMEVR